MPHFEIEKNARKIQEKGYKKYTWIYGEFLERRNTWRPMWWVLREICFLYTISSPLYHNFPQVLTLQLPDVTLGPWAISGSTDCFGCCTLGDRRVIFSRGAQSVLREACWTRASTKFVNVLVCSLLQSRSIFQDSRWWILESRMLSSAREGPTRDAAWIKIGI